MIDFVLFLAVIQEHENTEFLSRYDFDNNEGEENIFHLDNICFEYHRTAQSTLC